MKTHPRLGLVAMSALAVVLSSAGGASASPWTAPQPYTQSSNVVIGSPVAYGGGSLDATAMRANAEPSSAPAPIWGIDPSSPDKELLAFDAWTGTEYMRIPLPGDPAGDTDLALAGKADTLYYVNGNDGDGNVYAINPENGAVKETVNFEGGWDVDGIGWFNGYLFTSGCTLNDMHRYPVAGGSPIFYWAGVRNPLSVGGDDTGRIFTTTHNGSVQLIAEVNPVSNVAPLNTFASPSQTVVGMAFDGQYLFVSDTSNKVFILDPGDGTVLNTLEMEHALYGLAVAWVPNRPPVAVAGDDQTVEQTSCEGAEVTLDGTGSSDQDGDELTYTWKVGEDIIATGATPQVTLPVGTTTVSLIVNDGQVDSAPDTVDITVQDTTAPTIAVSVTPDVLWPANHQMVDITAAVDVSDVCDTNLTVVLTSVTSDEPDDATGAGDGNTINDIQLGTDDLNFMLRAERQGAGDGRVYTVTYTVTDASGNSAIGVDTVAVPHAQ